MVARLQKNDLNVVKSNRLVEASYRLTLTEQQLVLYSIVQAREQDRLIPSNDSIAVDAAAFAKQFKIDPRNVYSMLKEATETLFKRWVLIHDTHPKTGMPRVVKTRWVSDIAYVDGAGLVEFTFAPKIVPYIARLESEFTQYRLEKIANMTSAYAIRLYELLIQYQGSDKKDRTFELAELREIFGLTTEYKLLADFKKYVIETAIKQINKHADLKVDYDQKKTGRTVSHIILKWKPKAADIDKPSNRKKVVVNRPYVEKHARPGESYDQAHRRLLEEAGQLTLNIESITLCTETDSCTKPARKVTQQGQTYMDWKCLNCGGSGRSTWE